MNEAANVIRLVMETPGATQKQYLLKKNEHVKYLKDILHFIYNPYIKTGISTAKLKRALERTSIREPAWAPLMPEFNCLETIKYFSIHQTGSDKDLEFAAQFIRSTARLYPDNPFATVLAKAIVTQNLSIGVGVKYLNTVYGDGFIPVIGCMLGTKITKIKYENILWPCIATEKLDGIRRILVKERGICRLYSRSGHEDTKLVDILEDAKLLPDNRVYDGELLADGIFADSIEQRQATSALTSSGGATHGVSFNVFDMLPIEEFYKGISEDTAITRKVILAATFNDESVQILEPERWPRLLAAYGMPNTPKHIKAVPILGLLDSMNEVDEIVAPIWAMGREGIMLNTASGFYELKRSTGLLKIKHTECAVLTITGFTEGKDAFVGMLGALELDYKGTRLGVGSGFNLAQRMDIWNNKDKYVGRKVEIDTFGESTNKLGAVSLNCPIFKRFKGAEE